MGIAFNQYNKITVVWKYEARCTLYEVLDNDDFNMADEFQMSFGRRHRQGRGVPARDVEVVPWTTQSALVHCHAAVDGED